MTERYGEKLVIAELNFTDEAGMVTDFLRPNSIGKSTTVGIIVGLDFPSVGEVTVNGKDHLTVVELTQVKA